MDRSNKALHCSSRSTTLPSFETIADPSPQEAIGTFCFYKLPPIDSLAKNTFCFPEKYRGILHGKRDVRLSLNKDEIVFEFHWNPLVIEAVKTLSNRRWDGISKTWRCNETVAPECVALFEHMGRTPEKAVKEKALFYSILSHKGIPNSKLQLNVSVMKISIKAHLQTSSCVDMLLNDTVNVGKVVATFNYDKSVVEAMKRIHPNHRNYDANAKTWSFHLFELPDLVQFLAEDLSYSISAKLEYVCCLCRTLCKLLASLIPEDAYVEDKENLVKADNIKTTYPDEKNSKTVDNCSDKKSEHAVHNGENIDREQKQKLVLEFLKHIEQEISGIHDDTLASEKRFIRQNLASSNDTNGKKRKAEMPEQPPGSILRYTKIKTEVEEKKSPDHVLQSEMLTAVISEVEQAEERVARLIHSFAARDRERATASSVTPSTYTTIELSPLLHLGKGSTCCEKCKQPKNHYKYFAKGGHVCRFIGFYKCFNCSHRWASAWCWENENQCCRNCDSENTAETLETLDWDRQEGRGGGEHDQTGGGEHDQTRCSRCRKLGQLCKGY